MKLGDIITLRKGNTIEIQDTETYRISGIQNYGKGVIVRRVVKGAELTMRQYQVIEPNQLMWCKVDTKNGAFGITHSEHTGTLASPNMALADINLEKADPSFLETLFRVQSFADYITHLSSGTTNRKYLTPPELLKQVMLPDWEPEQQRAFVSKLRQIEECGLAREITHQQSLLAKLKQAILQEAIQGKLTADWRAAHPDVEPACQLLKRIQAEKARLIAAKKLRPEKPLPKITPAEIPFEIPNGWEWCRTGDLAQMSLGKMLDKSKNTGIVMPYLGNINVRWYRVETLDLKTLKLGEREIDQYSVENGDVLVCEGGGGIGRTAVWTDDNPMVFQKALHRVRFYGALFNPFLFNHYMKLCVENGFIESFFTGAGIPHLTSKSLKTLPIPLPPLAEQAAIMERVEALMTTCRALEAEIEHARTHAAHLLQAVLKEAFVPSEK
jgi:type I restriction enzyme, S subunit